MLVFKYVKTTNVGVLKYVKCNACLDDLWNVLPVPAGGAAGLAIDFKVYDFDAGSEDDCMGELRLQVADLNTKMNF